MPANFEHVCKTARDGIAVPPIPLDAIVLGAQTGSAKRTAGRRRGVLAAVIASISLAAGAAAAEYYNHVQVTLKPSGEVNVSLDKGGGYRATIRDPKPADFEKAARAVNFPVVLPVGLPAGTKAEALMVFGPGAMQIIYNLPGAWRRSNHLLFVMLANPSAVATAAKPPQATYQLRFGPAMGSHGARWVVGREEVIILNSTITPAELARVKAAMLARSR